MKLSEDDVQGIGILLSALKNHQLDKVKAKSTNQWRDLNAEDLDFVISESSSDIDITLEDNYFNEGNKTIHTLLSYSMFYSTPEIFGVLLSDYELNPNIPLAIKFFDVQNGEDIEAFEISDITVLIIAIKEGLYDMARTLLEHGATPNGAWHALGQASMKNSRAMEDQFFSLLLHYGTDLSHAVFEYLSGIGIDTEDFEQAIQQEDILPRIESALVRFKKVGACTKSPRPGECLAHIAAKHPALLNCVQRYFSLPPIDNEIAPPLLLGHICPTTLNILKRSGHDFLKKDAFGNCLLHKWALEMCAAYDSDELNNEVMRSFEQIVAAKFNIDELNNRKQTSLHLAALYKSSIAIELLLSKGADPNAKDINGLTPFAYALISNTVESELDENDYNYVFADDIDEEVLVVEKLMGKGVNLEMATNNGISLSELVATSKDFIFSKVTSQVSQKYRELFQSARRSSASVRIYFYSEMNMTTVAGYMYCGDTNVIAKRG